MNNKTRTTEAVAPGTAANCTESMIHNDLQAILTSVNTIGENLKTGINQCLIYAGRVWGTKGRCPVCNARVKTWDAPDGAVLHGCPDHFHSQIGGKLKPEDIL